MVTSAKKDPYKESHDFNTCDGYSIFLVGAAAVIFQLTHNSAGTVEVSGVSNILFLVGLGLIGVYIRAGFCRWKMLKRSWKPGVRNITKLGHMELWVTWLQWNLLRPWVWEVETL